MATKRKKAVIQAGLSDRLSSALDEIRDAYPWAEAQLGKARSYLIRIITRAQRHLEKEAEKVVRLERLTERKAVKVAKLKARIEAARASLAQLEA